MQGFVLRLDGINFVFRYIFSPPLSSFGILCFVRLLLMQFYNKFNIRQNIAGLLEYLWSVPSHHNYWRKVLLSLLLFLPDCSL